MAGPRTARYHAGPEIADFLRRTKMSQSKFGRAVCNSHHLVPTILMDGRTVGYKMYMRIKEFMAGYDSN